MTITVQPRRVLVGYDGSPAADAALLAAVDDAAPDDILHVAYVHPPAATMWGYPHYEHAMREREDAAREVLDRAATLTAASLAEVRLEIHEGDPAAVLADLARRRDAEVLVVGARHGHWWDRGGRTRRGLSREPTRPVLVVPAPDP